MTPLIFNPLYQLIDDYDRVIIVMMKDGRYKEYSAYFIHPFYAEFLSMFDGRNNEYAKLEKRGLAKNDIKKLSSIFTNNDSMYVGYAGEKYNFPKDVLIPNDSGIIRDDLLGTYCCNQPYDFRRKRYSLPRTIVYIVNMKCYTDCIYCYANRKYPHKLMNTSKIVKIIEEAKKIGILDFTISGGEFFLQKDWDIILGSLIENNYEPEISTKVPLSDSDILTAKKLGLNDIQFSLDTINSSVSTKTLNVKKSYILEIMRSIKFADSIGFNIVLKPTFCKYTCNIDNLKDILNFANTLRNIKRVTVSTAGKSIYLSDEYWDSIRPSIEQVEAIEKYIDECSYNFEIISDSNVVYKDEVCNSSSFSNRSLCTANLDGFILLPDGKVTICEELYWQDYFILGDLNKNSILDIWKSEKALNLWNISQKDFPDYSSCKICDDFKSCRQGLGVCWKMVMQAYGEDEIFYPDPRCPKAPMPTLNVVDK